MKFTNKQSIFDEETGKIAYFYEKGELKVYCKAKTVEQFINIIPNLKVTNAFYNKLS